MKFILAFLDVPQRQFPELNERVYFRPDPFKETQVRSGGAAAPAAGAAAPAAGAKPAAGAATPAAGAKPAAGAAAAKPAAPAKK